MYRSCFVIGAMQKELLDAVAGHTLKTPAKVRIAPGSLGQLAEETAALAPADRALVVTGSKSGGRTGTLDRAARLLRQAGFETHYTGALAGEPSVEQVNRMAADARQLQPAIVIGLGGGSVLDAAKAIAALATNEGLAEDYLEGVGRGWTLRETPLPFVAIPTTAGTGAEMTKNAVLGSPFGKFKKSMRDDRMLARLVILDAELTYTVPASVTAAGGMDTLTQLIEPCITVKRTPATTSLAHLALGRVREALPRCCTTPRDLDARTAMLLASSISGVCLANAGLALAHGIASGLGGRHPLAHGLICGILLPHTLRHNRSACEDVLAEALRCFLNEPDVKPDTIDRGVQKIETLNRRLGIPPDLRFLRLSTQERFAVAEASMGSSMSGNPLGMEAASVDRFLAGICG